MLSIHELGHHPRRANDWRFSGCEERKSFQRIDILRKERQLGVPSSFSCLSDSVRSFSSRSNALAWKKKLPNLAAAPASIQKTETSDTTTGKSPDKSRLVEAILIICREPISARKLALLAELEDPTEARTLARKLNEEYDQNAYAFRIEEIAGGLQLLTRPQFANWLRRLELVPPETILSQGMLETLSIIAYRQPVQRSEIEAIRGVATDEVLRQLMQRDLVRIVGRHEDLGRPYLYGTTRRFLQLFGLQSLESLPRAQKIRRAEAEIASRLAVPAEAVQDMQTGDEPD